METIFRFPSGVASRSYGASQELFSNLEVENILKTFFIYAQGLILNV